jgi:hypothetical protein
MTHPAIETRRNVVKVMRPIKAAVAILVAVSTAK